MESPTASKGDSPEVTGVSRSGRVRKKSSKLADFESPDEIDNRFKRKIDRHARSPTKFSKSSGDLDFDDSDADLDADLAIDIKEDDLDDGGWEDNEEESNDYMDIKEEELDEDKLDPLQVDEDSADGSSKGESSGFSQAQSLYFSEKHGKKNIIVKDGIVQRKKAQRKDKGQSRFTAYMLWARDVRPQITEANPNMDFSSVNKRLGEMWALVPTTQKYNWKRRAKRLAAKGNTKGSMIRTGKASKQSGSSSKSTLINKSSGKSHQSSRSSGKHTDPSIATASQTPPQQMSMNLKSPVQMQKSSRAPVLTSSNLSDLSPTSAYKVTGTSPIDVAAHLKLLGESLNNIGQKLKEHEGQIAVSGSLSVLLDSMLCVLGPLTCLTGQVEELQGAVPVNTLSQILDNIAYIMPGIV